MKCTKWIRKYERHQFSFSIHLKRAIYANAESMCVLKKYIYVYVCISNIYLYLVRGERTTRDDRRHLLRKMENTRANRFSIGIDDILVAWLKANWNTDNWRCTKQHVGCVVWNRSSSARLHPLYCSQQASFYFINAECASERVVANEPACVREWRQWAISK